MTVPMWSPFAALAVVCTVYPKPRWVHRVEWYAVATLVYCLTVWAVVGLIVWWQVL